MKATFMKTAPYEIGIKKSKYEEYEPIVLQNFSPRLTKDAEDYILANVDFAKIKDADLIITSAESRTQETANIIARHANRAVPIIQDNSIAEIKFSLHKLVTKSEYERFGSTIVRKRFISAFIEDALLESRKEIKKRMDEFIFRLNAMGERKVLCISHSFFMKLLEIYSKEPALFLRPELLRKHIAVEKALFKCCETIEIDLETFNKLKK